MEQQDIHAQRAWSSTRCAMLCSMDPLVALVNSDQVVLAEINILSECGKFDLQSERSQMESLSIRITVSNDGLQFETYSESDDPHLHNDSLSLLDTPQSTWSNIPTMIQLEMFDQLGWYDKRSLRRVCRLWKQLLERQSSVFLLEVPTALSQVMAETGQTLTPKKRLASFLRDVGEYFMPIAFFEPPKTVVPAPDLCRALECSQVLVLRFLAEDSQDPRKSDIVLLMELYSKLGIVELMRRSHTLHHVVMSIGRPPISIDFRCDEYLLWVDEIIALSITLQRPITYSLASSVVYFLHYVCEPWKGVHCQLVPDICNDLPMPVISFKAPADRTAICNRVDMGLRKTILPYSEKQLMWLQRCRRLMEEDENCDYTLDSWQFSEHKLKQNIASFSAGNCSGDHSKHPLEPHLRFGTLECEQLAVMISLLARMISAGS